MPTLATTEAAASGGGGGGDDGGNDVGGPPTTATATMLNETSPGANNIHTAGSSSNGSIITTAAAATSLADLLVLAQYHPPTIGSTRSNDTNNNTTNTTKPMMWWPALRFESLHSLHEGLNELEQMPSWWWGTATNTTTTTSSTSTTSSTTAQQQNHQHHRHQLVKRQLRLAAMDECLGESIEALLYLGRPLEDFRTAVDSQNAREDDQSLSSQLCVHDLVSNLRILKEQCIGRPAVFPSEALYFDFHRAMDLAKKLFAHSLNTDTTPASGTVGNVGNTISVQNDQTFLKQAQKGWEEYQHEQPQQEQEQEEESVVAVAEPAAQEHQHDDNDPPASPMAHSVAAVSLADDSTVPSACKESGHHHHGHLMRPRSPYPAPLQPPVLTNTMASPIRRDDSLDDVWHKHELDGWDRYKKTASANDDDGDDGLVYKAPNGYSFESSSSFRQHLHEAYGWEGPPPPPAPVPPKPTRASTRITRTNAAGGNTNTRTKSFGLLWNYLKEQGWTWFAASNNPQGYSTYYYRPGRASQGGKVTHLQHGVDFFGTEEEVRDFCRENDIEPPPPSPATSSSSSPEGEEKSLCVKTRHRQSSTTGTSNNDDDSDEEMEKEEQPDENDQDYFGHRQYDDGVDDTGYETPTDQQPSPRDPGQPIAPSPYSADGSSSNKINVDEAERYVWSNLWTRLKKQGWTWKRAANKLEDYWYIRSGAHEGRMEKGLDYFVSSDDVIDFCKKRDAHFEMANSKKRKRLQLQDDWSISPNRKPGLVEKKQKTARENARKQRALLALDLADKRHPCHDDNLVMIPSANTSAWAVNPPLYSHALCVEATGVVYSGSSYLFHLDGTNGVVCKYDTLQAFVVDFARRGDFTLASGSRFPTTDVEKEFLRSVQYAFVPGKPSEWMTIRSLSRNETALLLKKIGYSSSTNRAWKPPASLCNARVLMKEYASLDALCAALRSLEDFHNAPGGGGRRQRGAGGLTHSQMLALRLRVAEGFHWDEDDDEGDDHEIEFDLDENKKTAEKPASHFRSRPKAVAGVGGDEDVEMEDDEDFVPAAGTPTHFLDKEDKEKAHEALSPSKIKVDIFKHNPHENPAPWAQSNPMVRVGDWAHLFYEMGWTFVGYSYYPPGENSKVYSARFQSTYNIQKYLCNMGYDHYSDSLQKLNDADRVVMKRFLDYGNVPGKYSIWRSLRSLTLHEVIQFLELLGFAQEDEGFWTAPDHISHLSGQRFTSLTSLGNALKAVSQLEDRKQRSRRSRKDDDEVLNELQIIALRLRIAEGLEDPDNTKQRCCASGRLGVRQDVIKARRGDHSQVQPRRLGQSEDQIDQHAQQQGIDRALDNINESAANQYIEPAANDFVKTPAKESLSDPRSTSRSAGTASAVKVAEDFMSDLCRHEEALKIMQKLGCTYSSRGYRIPDEKYSAETFESQNQLVRFVLEKNVSVLDWDNCSLEADEIEAFGSYLKHYYADLKYHAPVRKALELLSNEENIFIYLERLGFVKESDRFFLREFSQIPDLGTMYDLEGVVNLIRTTRDLLSIGETEKRRRTYGRDKNGGKFLSKEEELAVRIWAAQADFPLPSFPDPHQFAKSNETTTTQRLFHDVKSVTDKCTAANACTTRESEVNHSFGGGATEGEETLNSTRPESPSEDTMDDNIDTGSEGTSPSSPWQGVKSSELLTQPDQEDGNDGYSASYEELDDKPEAPKDAPLQGGEDAKSEMERPKMMQEEDADEVNKQQENNISNASMLATQAKEDDMEEEGKGDDGAFGPSFDHSTFPSNQAEKDHGVFVDAAPGADQRRASKFLSTQPEEEEDDNDEESNGEEENDDTDKMEVITTSEDVGDSEKPQGLIDRARSGAKSFFQLCIGDKGGGPVNTGTAVDTAGGIDDKSLPSTKQKLSSPPQTPPVVDTTSPKKRSKRRSTASPSGLIGMFDKNTSKMADAAAMKRPPVNNQQTPHDVEDQDPFTGIFHPEPSTDSNLSTRATFMVRRDAVVGNDHNHDDDHGDEITDDIDDVYDDGVLFTREEDASYAKKLESGDMI